MVARRLFLYVIAVVVLSFAASAEESVQKIAVHWPDGSTGFAAITNTGTINAANRIFRSERIPAGAKATALDEVFTGTQASGTLVAAEPAVGEWFFAIDTTTGFFVVLQYTDSSFGASTSFTRWVIPGGNN